MDTEKAKANLIKEAKKLNKYLQIEVSIKLFDQTIFQWIYPPKKEKP